MAGLLDFTTSLYLGLRHPSTQLGGWDSLTLGAPAALAEPRLFRAVADAVARLQGCGSGLVAPSTLHLFWDLFGFLARRGHWVYWDEGIYPIARWGVERAAGLGAAVRRFAHYDPSALRRLLATCRRGTRPIIVTDGFCPACGRMAPVAEYVACARDYGGLVVIDDTQSLGIFGHSPGPFAPYGTGGGGVLRWSGVSGGDIMLISSLAKGFGAPVAVMSGDSAIIEQFEAMSETRVHCSPPSMAVVLAARRALAVNRQRGDQLRVRLADLVKRFRAGLKGTGFAAIPGLFPMQTLDPMPIQEAKVLHDRLSGAGVKAVLQQDRRGRGARLTFIITAVHEPQMIDRAIESLQSIRNRKRMTGEAAWL